MDDESKKQLRIKVGVLKRALKEHKMYTDEVEKLTAEVAAMGPEHDKFRQTSQVLEESKTMATDAANRVPEGKEDVEAFLETETLDEEEELVKEARQLLETASAI